MKKKALAILLGFSIIVATLPTLAFATSGETTSVTETITITEVAASVCPICQRETCIAEHKQCEVCGGYDCTETHVSVCNCDILCSADAIKADCPVCSTTSGACVGSDRYIRVQAMIDAMRTEYSASERAAAFAEYEAVTKAIGELSDEEIALLDLTNYYAAANPTVIPTEGEDCDFTNAVGDEFGEGWSWNNNTKTLTLSGAAITEQVILPTDSTIYVTADSSIIPAQAMACISTAGSITINGSGKLTLNALCEGTYSNTIEGAASISISNVSLIAVGNYGLAANNISIRNSDVDITGQVDGLSVVNSGSSKITLENVSGTIVGSTKNGINMEISDSGVAASGVVDIISCSNLTIRTNATSTGNGQFYYSAVRAFITDTDCNVSVNISECSELNFYGSGGGICVNCSSGGSTGNSSVNIDNSNVYINTSTRYWGAIFANNVGNTAGDASINISSSRVTAFCGRSAVFMTSTYYGASTVNISDSIVDLSSPAVGIRVNCNNKDADAAAEAEDANIVGSLVVITGDKPKAGYHVVDDPNDITTSVMDESSILITPVFGTSTVITANTDGTWSIPENGEIYIDGEERTYPKGAIVNSDGTIIGIPYAVFTYTVVTTGGGIGGSVDKNEESMVTLNEVAEGSQVTVKSGYTFEGWFIDAACTQKVSDSLVDSANKLTPQRNSEGLYESGTFYAKFVKDHATVTITKTIDKASSSDQSFILNISGTTYNNGSVDVDIIIVIPAGQTSGFVKVALPVSGDGAYTISDTDTWNWRYKVENDATITINQGEFDRALSVTSTLENSKWFADSCIYAYKKES